MVAELFALHEVPVDVFRIFNIVLAVAVLVSMAIQWRALRDADRASALLRFTVGLMSISVLVGSIETVVAEVTAPGIRTYLNTVALWWTLASIWWERHDSRGNR